MDARWKKGLAFGAAAGAVWLGAERCEENGGERPKPPVGDTDTGDISHAVRDRLQETKAVRPRPHFVPPLPPREGLAIDDPERPPANLADHLNPSGVDKATRDKVLRAIFDKADCTKEGGAAHKECTDNRRKQRPGEGKKSMAEISRELHEIKRAIHECDATRQKAEEACLERKRKENPEAHATEEHYFLAQNAAKLAGLEEAVRNGTPMRQEELMDALQNMRFAITWGVEDNAEEAGAALQKVLKAAGLSVDQFVGMLETILTDYIPPYEESRTGDDEQTWDPASQPTPPDTNRMREIANDLLDLAGGLR